MEVEMARTVLTRRRIAGTAVATMVAASGALVASDGAGPYAPDFRQHGRAKNVILFIGDGMGVSTVTATRVYSVGVDGKLVVDQFPYTALSRTYSSDAITPDSAPTMTAMMTGHNTNAGVIGLDESTEYDDFNKDGDGRRLRTLLEMAKARGMKTGVVSTARITHATPAATYAHINDRNDENAIALQALPGDATYNRALGDGVDLLFGGGRQFFVPNGVADEEGGGGSRSDGRDLRQEFQDAGYTYVHNQTGFNALRNDDLPVLGLFERSHMEYEYDRKNDTGGEPSLSDMTRKAIRLLSQGSRKPKQPRGWPFLGQWWNGGGRDEGFFLMVESGRIDHAHHEGNAFRALTDTEEFDRAIGAATALVDLRDTIIIVSADHSHVFNIAGYPLRPKNELPYPLFATPPGYDNLKGNGILDLVYDVDAATGAVAPSTDANGAPYTVLSYANGPGYRGPVARVNPLMDPFPGRDGGPTSGPWDPDYFQEATVPLSSETHSGEEVAIYAIGAGADAVRGTVKNTFIFKVMKAALGID
jgi:alkaline phosphatase